ncbi:DNA cytosine methyltransferase [bacterium]|nr:DNA cytosine methyltransferase [bacterium]
MTNVSELMESLSNDNMEGGDSALQHSSEAKEQFFSQGNTALKQEVVEQPIASSDISYVLPECLKNFSLEEILKQGKPTTEELEKLKASHANDNFDNWPTDPDEMKLFLASVENSIKAELILLKAFPLSEEEYIKCYNRIQMQRAYQLLAEFMIGQDLQSIERQYGVKKDSERRAEDGKVTKADVIKQRYPHLGARQIRDFQRLKLDNIWAAIVHAFSTGQELTRAMALSPRTKIKVDKTFKALPSKTTSWHAQEEDFETEFKTLELTEEIGATSLFANIGVGTSLLEKHTKIRVTVANEYVPRRAKAHKRLYPACNVIEGSITDEDVFNKVVAMHKACQNQICFISCPCQDASSLNTSADKGKGERAALFKASLDFIEATMPDYITFENVPQWLGSRPEFAVDILVDKTIGEYVVEALKCLGYNTTVGILSAADYGTSEDRKRAIILACKSQYGVWKFPKKHKFRPTVFDAIGAMTSLEAGKVDPNNKWHYGLPLSPHEVEFLRHTPVGCSAWDNIKKYQPITKKGAPAKALFSASYTRLDPAYPSTVIESGSGILSDVHSVHFGRPLSDGTYSDSRVLSIAEILKLIGADDDFLEPLDAPKTSEEDFDGLTWESGMLISRDEDFIREVLGEHICPKFMLNLVSTMPLPTPANDNATPEEITEESKEETTEVEKEEKAE